MVTARTVSGIRQLSSFTNYHVIFLFCLPFVPVSTQDDKTTCSIAIVERFQNTILTCHFPEDLSVTKKDFTVYHYVEQGNPESVLDCWWIRGSQECYSKPGFKYDKRISRTLNLTVDRVVDKHVGKYVCQIAGYGSTFSETCEFFLDAYNTCNISKESNDSQIALTCFFNEDIEKTQINFTVYKHNEQEKLINRTVVVDCWWENGNPRCRGEKGYLYDEKVSTNFSMAIPTAANGKAYNYSCWHGGSHGDQVKTCSLATESNGVEPERESGFDSAVLEAIEAALIVLGVIMSVITGTMCCTRRPRSWFQLCTT